MGNESYILADLRGENNLAFGEIYKKHFASVERFITNNSGSASDAQDIFQDTLIVVLQKLRQDNFVLSASLKTYIMAIAKHLWLKKLRVPYQEQAFSEFYSNSLQQQVNSSIEEESSYMEKLLHYMHRVTNHCKGLLHDMFFKNKTIEQVQEQYGYSSRHNAINQKHKCVEQIRRVKAAAEKNN
ncbi:MAG: sigma-70 family RNA polymerase sigma factor [Ferruginibacter sp.]